MQFEQQKQQLDEELERERELEHVLMVNALTESPDCSRVVVYENSSYYHDASTSTRTPTTMWQNFWFAI